VKLGRFWILLIVSCLFLIGLAWQASRFADLDSRARALESEQQSWIAQNRRIEAEIALLSSRERTAEMASKLGLKRALPEERLRIQLSASGGSSHD